MEIASLKHGVSATLQAPSIQIEDFRGDLAQVAALIQESWEENAAQGLFYTPEFLASCLKYPGSNYSLAPTLYQGDKPRAFVAGFPRTFLYKGRELRAILCTLLSVCSEFKKSGYGIVLWSELVKRARDAGYDAMVNYCVDGESMNGMIVGSCRMLKLPTQRVFSVHYLMRVLQPKAAHAPADHPDHHLAEKFQQAAGWISDATSLRRVWTEPETQWQLHRHDGLVVSHSAGGRQGLLTAYLMHAANPLRTKCLLIEDGLWGTLESEERLILVERLLDQGI